MPSPEKLAKKQKYFDKLIHGLESTPCSLIISVDHVGSKQMQNIRMALRGKAEVLMGKNTMIRTALRRRIEETGDEGLKNLAEVIRGNIGFVFTQPGQTDVVRQVLKEHVVPAMAKSGVIAPVSVSLPSGPTGLDPAQTSFFQALNIATKIVKGQIELTTQVEIVTAGEAVSSSAQVLLNKLNIKPFLYGVEVRMVYQGGSVFDAAVLDITDAVVMQKFMNGVANVAALGREIGIPTEAGVPHMIANAFKNVAALVADLDFVFKEVEIVKEYLADPSKFVCAAAPAASAGAADTKAAVAAAPVVEEEEEEEEMEFDLFG